MRPRSSGIWKGGRKGVSGSCDRPKRTSQRFLVTFKSLQRSRPPVERFDVPRVELQGLVAVRHDLFVLWRFHADVARGAIAVEHGLGLRRHRDGARVKSGRYGELSGLVRVVALLFQRSRERLAFLSTFG